MDNITPTNPQQTPVPPVPKDQVYSDMQGRSKWLKKVIVAVLVMVIAGGTIFYRSNETFRRKFKYSAMRVIATILQQPPLPCIDCVIVCPKDIRTCPDGSTTERVGSKCEFAECPHVNPTNPPLIPTEEFFGIETVRGYLKRVEQFTQRYENDPAGHTVICTYFIITDPDSKIRSTIKQRRIMGNGLDYENDDEVGVSIDLQQVAQLPAGKQILEALESSNNKSQLAVLVERFNPRGGGGVGACYSMVKVINTQ